MHAITDIFIKRPVLAIVLNLIVVLVGLRGMFSLPVQQYPKLESTSIEITTIYIGASAETVRGFLTTPIEQAVSSIAGIDYIESESTAGVSKITVRLKLNPNSTAALAEISARLQQVRRELPAEAEPPQVDLTRADRPYASFYLSFTSTDLTIPQLTDWLIRNIQPQLKTLPGVQRVGIEAGQLPAMRIWIDPERLSEVNLTPGDVYNALRRNNYVAAIGRLKSDSVQVDLLTNTDLKTADEFRDLIVADRNDASIRLGEIARVELGSEEPMMNALYGGKQAVYVSVWPLPGSNEIDVAHKLRAEMDRLKGTLPKNIDMQLAFDATKFMENAISEITKTLFETILIVGIVVFLFMGSLRTAIVPLIAMPVSLIGAVLIMLVMGFSLNLLTLLAIVLSVGLVVDDAIVVVENIQRHVQEGKTRIQAALIGARELVGPIIAMTITLATVYAPIGIQSGLTGMLFKEFAFTLASAVLVSGVVAVTLSPIMSAYMISPAGNEGFLTRFVNRRFERLKDWYGHILEWALVARWGIFAGTIAIALAAVPLFMFSGKELAPAEDQSAIAVMLQSAPNSTLEASTKSTLGLADSFAQLPETRYMWALAGASGGFGGVITKDFQERNRSTMQMLPDVMAIAAQSAGLQAFPVVIPPLPGAGNYGVEVYLKTDLAPEELVELSNQIVQRVMESQMFMFADTNFKFDLPQARVVVDREKVADLGMDLASVAQELGVLLGGGYVNRFNYFNRSYQVIPQLAAEDRKNMSSLMNLKIRAPNGELIPVSSFASIEPNTAPRSLKRFQQQAAIQIFGEPLPIPMITKEMCLSKMEEIIREVAGDRVSIDYGGESRQIRNESASLTVTLGFALVLIYLVLSAQFHSFRDPLIVLLGSVPLAISGALALTFVGLTTINIYSQVGLITLVGLVAKNGILIVEFANQLQEQGQSKLLAIREAARTRLRPVLITSAATVLGHFPLVIVEGPGAMARNSIGIVLVAGMLIGTFFTLFVVPALYLLFAARHRSREEDAQQYAV